MKRIVFIVFVLASYLTNAQVKRDKATYKEPAKGYYQTVIVKQNDSVKAAKTEKENRKSFKMDLSDLDIPTNPSLFTQAWHNKPISQGQTGTCWCYSTTSFYESEVKRITGQEVKLSEMFPVYWQYVERAKYFVEKRGKMTFGEGSETNAVAEMMRKYGTVPMADYIGRPADQPFPNHEPMFAELDNYLKSVKERNEWNEETVVATTKSILNHYLGVPPTTVTVAGKIYTPQDYVTKVLKLKLEEFVNFMSLESEDFYETEEYKVGDNWWHAKNYNNVPCEDFMSAVKMAIKKGYTISIGGDVSESGFISSSNVAVVPTYDIPSEYIDDNARLVRFLNGSTTDDHAMHLVGYMEKDGKMWFLVKDSGAGSRNCGETCKSFGYYYMSEDYIKLKMMTLTVNKAAVEEILQKMKRS